MPSSITVGEVVIDRVEPVGLQVDRAARACPTCPVEYLGDHLLIHVGQRHRQPTVHDHSEQDGEEEAVHEDKHKSHVPDERKPGVVVVVSLLDFLQANVIAIIKGSSNLNLFKIIEVGLFV